MPKNPRNKRITKQHTKEKAPKDSSLEAQQPHTLAPASGRQLRCHKQSGKKTNESKHAMAKQLPTKRRAVRTSKNTRDKSKDRTTDTNGCALLLDDQQRKAETTVTILKQADDFAHAQNGKSQSGRVAQAHPNQYANNAATLHKRQRREY